MDWIVGIMWLAGLAVLTVWFIAFVRHIFRLPSVQKSINGMSHAYLAVPGFVFILRLGEQRQTKSLLLLPIQHGN